MSFAASLVEAIDNNGPWAEHLETSDEHRAELIDLTKRERSIEIPEGCTQDETWTRMPIEVISKKRKVDEVDNNRPICIPPALYRPFSRQVIDNRSYSRCWNRSAITLHQLLEKIHTFGTESSTSHQRT